MHIAILNAKGGMGKSSLSVAIAKEINAAVITNDPHTRLQQVLPARSVMKLLPEDDVPNIPITKNVIWDIGGGFTDYRVPIILRDASLVVVPIRFGNINDWTVTKAAILEVLKHNDNVAIIINAIEYKSDLDKLSDAINTMFPSIPCLVLGRTKAMKEMLAGGEGITRRGELSGLAKYQLKATKEVLDKIIGLAK